MQSVQWAGGAAGATVPVLFAIQSRSELSDLQQSPAPFRQTAAQRVPALPIFYRPELRATYNIITTHLYK